MTLTHSLLRMMRSEIHRFSLPSAILFPFIYARTLQEQVSSSGSKMGFTGRAWTRVRNQAEPAGKNIMYNQLLFLSHCHHVCLPTYSYHVDHAIFRVGFHCAVGGLSMQASCDGRRRLITRLRLRQLTRMIGWNHSCILQ